NGCERVWMSLSSGYAVVCTARYSAFPRLFSFPFFFCCTVHPRDLHSFPTRRSSDLAVPPPAPAAPADARPSPPPRAPPAEAMARSEEHTSELQSRENLVCRLLLEKKKKDKDLAPEDSQNQASRFVNIHTTGNEALA